MQTEDVCMQPDELDKISDQSSRSLFTRERNIKCKNLELGCPVVDHELNMLDQYHSLVFDNRVVDDGRWPIAFRKFYRVLG
ncbi:unnamed protein product [Macrosiphum euphorbiae]|nr:unnamed protein product [Macrosiphum euphorbiae]